MFLRAFALRGGLRSRVHSLLRLSQRWLKVNSHDQKMSICVAGISRRTRTNAGQPRAHLRPEKPGRERPPLDQGAGSGLRLERGVAHAPVTTSTIRAAPAAAQSAADVSGIEHMHVHGAKWVAGTLFGRRPRQGRRWRLDPATLKGDNSDFRDCPPFCPPAPSPRPLS
jgi:hypothetical protein